MTQKTKQEMIIAAFREGSLNRFQAEKIGDHCLNTTVSILRKQGYKFASEFEKVETRFGRECSVKRYWMVEEPKEKARNPKSKRAQSNNIS